MRDADFNTSFIKVIHNYIIGMNQATYSLIVLDYSLKQVRQIESKSPSPNRKVV